MTCSASVEYRSDASSVVNALPDAMFERRLSAIVFADVSAFSCQLELDDQAAMRDWKRIRAQIIEPTIVAEGGRLMRVVGDGLFIDFLSARSAVRWAVSVQQRIDAERAGGRSEIVMRIGVNLGDVLVDEGELHGTSVNIAARVLQLAAPGEIVVTAAVRSVVHREFGLDFETLGEFRLKNISSPVHVSRLVVGSRRVAGGALPADLRDEAAAGRRLELTAKRVWNAAARRAHAWGMGLIAAGLLIGVNLGETRGLVASLELVAKSALTS